MTDELRHPADVLRMALERERHALEFYRSMVGKVADEAVKVTLSEMADEEERHVRRLEEELDRFCQPDN